LILDKSNQRIERRFRVPFINSKYIAPVLFVLTLALLLAFNREGVVSFFNFGVPWEEFKHRIPLLGFSVLALVLVVYCFLKELSLIPVLGLLTCGYLMTELGWTNWVRFLAWLVAGLVLYFFYGSSHSKLARKV
jgi:basic amino acid/polyamine antiporter, APA family